MLVAKHATMGYHGRGPSAFYAFYNNSAIFLSHFPLETPTADANNPTTQLALWTLETGALK